MSISKNFKKLLSLLTVVCMVFAMIPATVSFAGSDDVISVATKLSALPDDSKAAILGTLWDYGVTQSTVSGAVYASDLVTEITSVLSNQNVIGDGANQISVSSVQVLANKVIQYRDVIVPLYGGLTAFGVTKDSLKANLNVTTDTELYKALLANVQPLIKLNSTTGKFEAVTNASAVFSNELSSLKIKSSAIILLTTFMFTPDTHTGLSYFDKALNKLNTDISTYSFDVTEVATLLRAYNICEVAATNGGTTVGGGSTGVTPTATPTATPAPTSAPTTVTGAITNLDSAIDKIATLDTAAAATAAAEAITAVSSLDLSKSSITDEAALQAKVEDLVAAVLDKASVQTVTATVTDSTAKVQLTDAAVSDITKAIDSVVSATEKLSEVVKATKLDVTVEKTLVLDAISGKNVNTASFEIPANVVAALTDKKFDSVVLKTDVATVKVDPKDLGNGNSAVTVSASKAAVPEQYKAVVGDSLAVDFSIKAGDKTISNFSKPVTVTMPYTIKAGEDKNNITVFYVSDNGKLENVAGYYDEATKSVVFTTKHFSLYVVKNNPVAFADVKSADWFKSYVETMAAKGIILGTNEGFLPGNKITRAEFAALLVRGFKLSDETAVNGFNDVNSNDWFVKDVAAAAKAGIVSGVGNGAFAPNANISRQDMAVMMARALVLVNNKSGGVVASTDNLFKDYGSIDSYAQAGVATAAKYAVIKGLPDGTFAPKADATRAEAATMIYNLFFLK